jgi:Na+-driven multidrug efflux pump
MMGIVNLFISLPVSYLFLYKMRLGIYGFILVRCVTECTKFCLASYVFFSKTHPQSRGLASLEDTLRDFRPYLIDSLKFTATSYSEHLGFAITGYLVALTGDINQMAAYYSIENFTVIPYCFGYSISIICKTRVNVLIGMDKAVTAGNFFRFAAICVYAIGGLLAIFTFLGRHYISDWYVSSDPDTNHWCVILVIIYSMFIWADVIMNLAMVGMKSLGLINLVMKYSSFTMLAGNMIIGGIVSKLNGNAPQLFFVNMITLSLLSTLNMRKSFMSDWSKAPIHQSDKPRDSISILLERELQIQTFDNKEQLKTG